MKILLFDDHKLLGESLTRALKEFEEVDVCDFVDIEKHFYNALRTYQYDIILLDINLKDASSLNGFEILDKLKEDNINSKVVILSSYDMPIYKEKAYEKGAADFINKSIEISQLVNRLRQVTNNKVVKTIRKESSLTNREVDVLKSICTGKTKKELAKELFISERTLYNHIQNIYDKLEVSNTVEAYNKAIKLGYIEPLM
ncbi:hypothetical protein FUSO7_12505 [Fusobacterium necrophorum BFTR-2]|uniref:response regulator transcription factor n=1 Tax=Tepidanaerobacter sp. EBM-38 TaxID=1918496 RepID=UPI0004615459|nr:MULTISPECIES: response regulator transcription factor [Bacteria]KDE68842.1 hypothetical protein FUSO7_12505 [Fusobacterium necrophorum BFTR-2]